MSHLDLSRIDLAFGSHLVGRQLSLQLEKGRLGCPLGPPRRRSTIASAMRPR